MCVQVHSHFVNPTRERLKGLLHGTMGLTSGLYIVLALCGYLYAYEDTKVSDGVRGRVNRQGPSVVPVG